MKSNYAWLCTLNSVPYMEVYLVKNQIKHKCNFQKTDKFLKKNYTKVDSKWIRHLIKKKKKKKKITTIIKDSPNLNITKNFTCQF
jgi:hypothetical protein